LELRFHQSKAKEEIDMTTMKHGPYVARIDYDPDLESFVGEVVNSSDTITFQGRSAPALKKEFAKSVKAHVAFCQRRGVEPGKPYSGRIPLRIPANLHRDLDANAAYQGISLNAYIKKTLEAESTKND
jgi:predicted HicB family RNase H-like nuclease